MHAMDDDVEIVPESECGNSSYTESPAVFMGLKKLFHLPSQENKTAMSPVIPMQGQVKLVKGPSENGDSDNESISLLTHSAPATQKTRNPTSSFLTPYIKAVCPQKSKTGQVSPDYSQTQPPELGYEVNAERPSWESITGLHNAPNDVEVDRVSIVSGSTHLSEPLIPLIDRTGTGILNDKRGSTDRTSSMLASQTCVHGLGGCEKRGPVPSYSEGTDMQEETTNDTQMSQPLIPLVSTVKQKKVVPLSGRPPAAIQVSVTQSNQQLKQSCGKDNAERKSSGIFSNHQISTTNRGDLKTPTSRETIDMDALLQKHSRDMDAMSSIERKLTLVIAKLQEQLSESSSAQLRSETSQFSKTLNQIGRSNKEEKEEMTQLIKGGLAANFNKSDLKQRLTMLTARQKKLLQLMTIHRQIVSKIGAKTEQEYMDNRQDLIKSDTGRKRSSDHKSKNISSGISCSQISSNSTGSLESRKAGGSLQDRKYILLQRAGLSVSSAAALTKDNRGQSDVCTHEPTNLTQLDNVPSSTSQFVKNQVAITMPAKTSSTGTTSAQSSGTSTAKDVPLLLPVQITMKQHESIKRKTTQPICTITKPSDLNLPPTTKQSLPQSHIKIPPSPPIAWSLLGPGNRLLVNTSKMQLAQAQPGLQINQIGTPESSVIVPPTTKFMNGEKLNCGFENSSQMISNQADGKTTQEVTVLTAKPPTGRQVQSKTTPLFPMPVYKFPGFSKRPLAPSMTSDDSSVVSRKKPRSYHVGLMNPSLKVAKEKKKKVKKTAKDSKLKQLVDQGIVQPGKDVLSIVTETNTFRASLKTDGLIQSSGGEIFQTPMSWCMAAVGTLQNRKMAYQKVIYNKRPLESYIDSLKTQMPDTTERTIQLDDVPLFKPVSQRKMAQKFDEDVQSSLPSKHPAEETKPKEALSVLDLLQNCRIELIDNMELIPSTELPSDFWSTDTLDKTLNWDFIDVW